MSIYSRVFTSSERYYVDDSTDIARQIPQIVKLINSECNTDINWQTSDVLWLNVSDLTEIAMRVNNECQDQLQKILSPYIIPKIEQMLGNRSEYNIKVSPQIKGVWDPKIGSDTTRRVFFKDSHWREDPILPNFLFPTRAHQDLDNNGNRSSHTLIFYFPLTPSDGHSSLIEFGNMPKEGIMYDFTDEFGYPNQIPNTTLEEMQWTSDGVKPGNIILMSAVVPHRSSKISQIPRIALNVKIQPTTLDFVTNLYDVKLPTQANSFGQFLKSWDDMLTDLVTSYPLLWYELAIIRFLQNKRDKSFDALQEFCAFQLSDDLFNRWMCASIMRKTISSITKADLQNLEDPIENRARFSCVDTIFNQFSLST